MLGIRIASAASCHFRIEAAEAGWLLMGLHYCHYAAAVIRAASCFEASLILRDPEGQVRVRTGSDMSIRIGYGAIRLLMAL